MTTTRVQLDDPFGLAAHAATDLRLGLGVAEHEVVVILGSGWADAADNLGDVVADLELSTVAGFRTVAEDASGGSTHHR